MRFFFAVFCKIIIFILVATTQLKVLLPESLFDFIINCRLLDKKPPTGALAPCFC